MEAESEEKNKAYEEEKQSLQEEHDKGLEEFRNSHSHQIGQLQVQLIERDALHQQDLEKVSKTLEDSKIIAFQRRSDETSAKLEALQQQLNREQINGSDAESKIEELQSNLADLQNRLEETQKAAALGTAAKAHLSKSVEEKDIFIRDKEEELGTTLDQVESLRSEHASQLSQIQTQHKDTKNRALELENSLNAMTLEHKSSLARKDLALQESLNTIKVLESLVHENVEKHNQSLSSKDTTIKSMNIDIENWDTAAVELASKHENAIKQKDGELNSYRLQVKELQSQVNATAEGNVKINKIRDLEINTMADKIKSLEETSSLSSNRMKNLSETKDQETETLHNSIKQLQMEIAAASDEHNDLIIQKNHKIITLQESIEGIERVSASNLEDLMATRDMETMGQKKKNRELEEALELVENERDSIKISLRESNDHAANVEVQKKRVEELEAAIQDYESKALDDQASVEKIHQSQIEEVRSKHASDLKNIRTAIEKRHGKDIEGLKSIHKGNIETTLSSIRAEHALKLASIQADVNKSDEDNQKLSNTLSSLQMELHKAKEVLAVEKKSTDTEYNQLKVELGDARNEVTALKKMLDIFDRESLEKDQSHSNSIQKIKSESEDTSKLLVDKTQSLQKVLADNANTLEKLKSESRKYQSNLKDADVKHTEVIQGLENEHAARDKESENAYLNSIAQLQQQLGDSVTNLDRAVEAERQLHADKINQLQTKQTVELEELQAQLIKFKSDCSTAQKELESMSNYEAELDLLKNKHAAKLDEQDKIHQRLKVKIAELSGNLNSSENSNNVQLQSHQLEIAEITRKLEAAQAARDMGVASHNEEVTALRRGHEHKLSELSTQMKLTEEEHEKQRQSGAEVRDRLVEQLRELEDARQSLPRLQGELVKSKQRVDHSDKEVNELRDSLDQAFVELNEERARTDDLREEVQALHDELDANAQGRGQANTELQKAHNTAKTAFIKEKSNNSVLKQQLEDATSATKLHLARVREVEAALKAHSAEIIELKTKISGPRASMTLGLAASKWVDNGNEAQMEDDSRDVGADLQGTVRFYEFQSIEMHTNCCRWPALMRN